MSEGGTPVAGAAVTSAVAAGGALGSLGRWLVGLAAGGAVWGTVLVNVTGALAMGLLVAWLEYRDTRPLVRPFAAVGLLGGWTTYSSFALDAHTLAGGGLGGVIGYVLATLALGLTGAVVGMLLGERAWGGDASAAEEIVQEEL